MKKEAAAIGIIGIPDDESFIMQDIGLGEPIKKIEKKGKIVLLVGKGLFKKIIVKPFRNSP